MLNMYKKIRDLWAIIMKIQVMLYNIFLLCYIVKEA